MPLKQNTIVCKSQSSASGRLRYAPESARYRATTPSELVKSSQEAGWAAILLEVHRVSPFAEVFEHGATPDQTIVVQTKGSQELESFKANRWQRATYNVGTVGMTPPMAVARLRRRLQPSSFEKVNLFIPQGFFEDAAEHYRRLGHRGFASPLSALAFNDPVIAQTAFSLIQALDGGAPDLYAQAAAQWLVTHLLSAHSAWIDVRGDRRRPERVSDKRLDRVVEYMSVHFAKALELEVLAAECAVSKFHFARLFRRKMGVSPHAFLVRLRLDAARSMLQSTDWSVSEVSSRCGFSRPTHLGTAFKKRYGMSPSNFRRSPD